MTRQIDNHSPGGVTGGKLVPSSHKRWEFRHTVIWHFSRGNQGIREVIPVPDGLGKELHLYASKLAVGIWNAMECWFLQRLVLGTSINTGKVTLMARLGAFPINKEMNFFLNCSCIIENQKMYKSCILETGKVTLNAQDETREWTL